MSANTEQRKLAAIMFTDIVGYSALAQRDEMWATAATRVRRSVAGWSFPRPQTCRLDDREGERYPNLERHASKPDVLAEIIKPRVNERRTVVPRFGGDELNTQQRMFAAIMFTDMVGWTLRRPPCSLRL